MAVIVHAPRRFCAIGVALLRRLAEPRHGLSVILRNALPGLIHCAKLELSVCKALLCRLAIPDYGFGVIQGYTAPVVVQEAENGLRLCVSLLGKFFDTGQSFDRLGSRLMAQLPAGPPDRARLY